MRIFLIFLQIYTSLLLADESFKVIVLGAHGGPKENNLSGYLIAPRESNCFVAFDAGSLLHGIEIAHLKESFQDIKVNPNSIWNFEAEILREHVTHYVISHAHLDHVAGLVINSTVDRKKNIYGINSTIDFIRDNLFNWKIWPNFGSEGKNPLYRYHYQRLRVEEQITLDLPEMTIKPFLLSHPDGYQSTAFLIGYHQSYLIYFGDTAPDNWEPKKHLYQIWEEIAPLVRQKKLKAIFLECSYTNADLDPARFGHLNPKYMIEELTQLAKLVDPLYPQYALQNLRIIVTHIKEGLLKGPSTQIIIQEELERLNRLNLNFIFPIQGEKLEI